MRPRAPTRLIASVANPLSCRTMAKSSERSAVPPLGNGVTGYPCTISGVPASIERFATELAGADQLFVIEMLLLGRVWLRFRHRAGWRVLPELVRGELAVEGGHMLRAGAVPFGRGSGVARCFGGAAAPVSRPRLAVGGHRAVHNPREVVEGEREVLAVP